MKKFSTLLEGVFRRYQGGSFLTGDVVKIKEDALNHDWTKAQGSNLIEKLKQFKEGGLNLRVSSVQAKRPAVSGSVQQDNQVDEYFCDIVQETAPGRWHEFITLPAHLLEEDNPTDTNLASIPDELKYDDGTHINADELESKGDSDGDTTKPFSQTQYADDGKGRLAHTNWRNPEENAPGKGLKWNDSEPGGGNMPTKAGSIYLEELKKH
jgi:hypothetical protein